ncbi:MAG: hypothetical protein HWD58_21100 [Bacteroidota bacterium]|nr:MAG: hypothetical protein HWD58_21100 [Bacteroidota bacterium]
MDSGTGLTAQIVLSAGEFDMSIDAGIHNASLPIGALGNYVCTIGIRMGCRMPPRMGYRV